MSPRIVIIGAGPTGLGAGIRLKQLGHDNWRIYESQAEPGGLAGSVTDSSGFTWDYGGHVLFTSFEPVLDVITSLPDDFFIEHQRKAFVRLDDALVPYPFQLNLEALPREKRPAILLGKKGKKKRSRPRNFLQWLDETFGPDLCSMFFYPYNQKVWGIPLEKMSYSWIENRITTPQDSAKKAEWGPNSTFLYPRSGGMGGFFKAVSRNFMTRISFGHKVAEIDIESKTLVTHNGKTDKFDFLLTTMPLNLLVGTVATGVPDRLKDIGKRLEWNSCTVSGLGFSRPEKEDFSWQYFPEPTYPFYRVTALSSYSSSLVPKADTGRFSSFMCETTTQSQGVPGGNELVGALCEAKILEQNDRRRLKAHTRLDIPYAYPIPTIERDRVLAELQGFLHSYDIFSRGRFGGWKYEVGNMDHSLMQGMEAVDRMLLGKKERVYALS